MIINRKEYQKQYRKKNQKDIQQYQHQKYLEDRKNRLTKARKRYILNREVILAQHKVKSLAHRGHAYSIWKAISKYAKLWGLPICTFEEFYDNWTFDDPTYQALYDAWRESGYDELLSPVVMRGVKKNGFVPENLKWDVKNNYSWWNEDATIYKESINRLEEQQKERNKRSREWRKKVYQDFKKKQKEKKKHESSSRD